MRYHSTCIPDAVLSKMPIEQRPTGRAGMTAAEAVAKQDAKAEKELQGQCIALLRQADIEVNYSRMDRRKTDRVGWPDLVFAHRGRPCAWECKLPGRKLSAAQEALHPKLKSNGWNVRVITSAAEMLVGLKQLEKEKCGI